MHTLISANPLVFSGTAARLPNQHKWLEHFERNRRHRPEPDWSAPITMSPQEIAALIPGSNNFTLAMEEVNAV